MLSLTTIAPDPDPFPHVVLDDAIDGALAREAWSAVPAADAPGWWLYDNALERKRAREDVSAWSDLHRELYFALESDAVVAWMRATFGLPSDLATDPIRRGAGLHRIDHGGVLAIHADHDRHPGPGPRAGWWRRANLVMFLGGPRDAGHLELWSSRGGRPFACARRLAPIGGRLVAWASSDQALHGHPEPLAGTLPRISMAAYFWSQEPPPGHVSLGHSTLYHARPGHPEDDTPDLVELRARRSVRRLEDRAT